MGAEEMAGLPTGEAKATAVTEMFDTIAPRYDLVNRLMTFGLDGGWRRRTVADLDLPQGSIVADLACGTGDLCRALADHGHLPIGVDLSGGMLAAARTDAPLVRADILTLPLPDGAVDGATCGFALRNVADLGHLFGEMARIVRPGGRISLLEVGGGSPSGLLGVGQRLYFDRVVPLIGALLSDRAAYSYLPESVAYLPEPLQLLEAIHRAGFEHIERRLMSAGATQLITATRSPT